MEPYKQNYKYFLIYFINKNLNILFISLIIDSE